MIGPDRKYDGLDKEIAAQILGEGDGFVEEGEGAADDL